MREILNIYGYEIIECEPQIRTISFTVMARINTRMASFRFPRMLFLKRPAKRIDDFYFYKTAYLNKPFEESDHVFRPYLVKQDMNFNDQCLNHDNQTELSTRPLKELIGLHWQTTFRATYTAIADDQFVEDGVNEIPKPAAFPQNKIKHCASLLAITEGQLKTFFKDYCEITQTRKLVEETKKESLHLFDAIFNTLKKAARK